MMSFKLNQYTTELVRYEESERIKDLGACWLFTNTEKRALGCSRFWAYEYGLELDKIGRATTLTYGIAFHIVLEQILKRIQEKGISCFTQTSIVSFAETIAKPYFEDEVESLISIPYEAQNDWIDEATARVLRAVEGWFLNWKKNVDPYYEVIAIEQVLSAPVFDFSYSQTLFRGSELEKMYPMFHAAYSPPSTIVLDEQGARPLRIDEDAEKLDTQKVNIPYWRCGKADAIVRARGSKMLYILDHKTTAQPNGYASKFSYDIQLPSYGALLYYEIKYGALKHLRDHDVGGVIWDLCHSKVPLPPKPLKSKELSQSKSRCVPSWIFEKALSRYEGKTDYSKHIQYLKERIDPNYFQILTLSLSKDDLVRSFKEDYATALKLHKLRSTLKGCDDIDFNWKAPRYPICEQYARCKYSSFCLPNTPLSQISENKNQKIRWNRLQDNTLSDIIVEREQQKLPF